MIVPGRCALIVYFLSLLIVPAVAQEEAEGPEHGKINMLDASPVDPGHFEVETSYRYADAARLWDNDARSHKRGLSSSHEAAITATAGLTDNLDVTVGSSYQWLRDKENDFDDDGAMRPEYGDHIGDTDISARYRFIESKEWSLDVAYSAGFTAPTGSSSSLGEIGTSQDYWSFNQMFVASKDWGHWTANIDAGYALPFGDKRRDSRGTLSADVAGGYQILPWLQPEAELNFSHDYIVHADDAQTLAMTAGLVMPIKESLRIMLGVQQGVWGRNADKATAYALAVKGAF